MERRAGMKLPAFKPLVVLPPLFWLVLAIASFATAFGVWQSQRLERLRPRTTTTPAPAADESKAGTLVEPAAASVPATDGAVPGTVAAGGAAPPRTQEPLAGRQVLRCVSKGRVTYRDLNAGCPEGAAERVTVFPTEGVGKPQ
jgi:hypothetical protein